MDISTNCCLFSPFSFLTCRPLILLGRFSCSVTYPDGHIPVQEYESGKTWTSSFLQGPFCYISFVRCCFQMWWLTAQCCFSCSDLKSRRKVLLGWQQQKSSHLAIFSRYWQHSPLVIFLKKCCGLQLQTETGKINEPESFLTFCVLLVRSKLEGDLCVWVYVPHLSGPFVSSLPLSPHLSAAKNMSQCWVLYMCQEMKQMCRTELTVIWAAIVLQHSV